MITRRRFRWSWRDDRGTGVAEYVAMVVVGALVVGTVGTTLTSGGTDLGNRARRAVCSVLQATGSAGGCPQAQARGGQPRVLAARSGGGTAALTAPAPAAAVAPPTTGKDPDGHTVILTSCGPA